MEFLNVIYKMKKRIACIISVSIAVVLLSVSLSGCADRGAVQPSYTGLGTDITEAVPSGTCSADTAGESVTAAVTATAAVTITATTSPQVSDEFTEKPFVPYTTANFFTLQKYSGIEYLIHEPAAKRKDKKYPILVWLHGSGEHTYIKDVPFQSVGGDLFNRMLRNINANPDYYESYVIVPVTPNWGPAPYALKGMINKAIAQGEGDPDRLYITGASMGGFATTDFLFIYPEMVACAVPLSGATYTSNRFGEILDIPIRIYHSKDDNVVPVINSRSYYNNIIAKGGTNAEYIELNGFGHYPYSYVFTQTDTIDWMYKQNRKANARPAD